MLHDGDRASYPWVMDSPGCGNSYWLVRVWDARYLRVTVEILSPASRHAVFGASLSTRARALCPTAT